MRSWLVCRASPQVGPRQLLLVLPPLQLPCLAPALVLQQQLGQEPLWRKQQPHVMLQQPCSSSSNNSSG
jgi:hypothetical protein